MHDRWQASGRAAWRSGVGGNALVEAVLRPGQVPVRSLRSARMWSKRSQCLRRPGCTREARLCAPGNALLRQPRVPRRRRDHRPTRPSPTDPGLLPAREARHRLAAQVRLRRRTTTPSRHARHCRCGRTWSWRRHDGSLDQGSRSILQRPGLPELAAIIWHRHSSACPIGESEHRGLGLSRDEA